MCSYRLCNGAGGGDGIESRAMSEKRRIPPLPTREVPEIPVGHPLVFPDEGGYVEEPSTAESLTPTPELVRDTTRCPHLVLLFGRDIGQVFKLDQTRTRLGRDRSCEIQLADSGISRQHVSIARDPIGRCTVRDLGSRNGTYLNEHRIARPELLRNNDLVHIGSNTVLKFIDSENPEADYALSMYEAAMNDVLTGVHNRRSLEEQLAKELAFARRHGVPLAVLLLDLDHFKRINDTHGHLVGDQMLKEFAELVGGSVRTEDTLGRYGGEEFAIICRHTGPTGATTKAERIRVLVSGHLFCAESHRLRLTVSIGVAAFDDTEGLGPQSILAYADHALYQAKQAGRDRVVRFGGP